MNAKKQTNPTSLPLVELLLGRHMGRNIPRDERWHIVLGNLNGPLFFVGKAPTKAQAIKKMRAIRRMILGSHPTDQQLHEAIHLLSEYVHHKEQANAKG